MNTTKSKLIINDLTIDVIKKDIKNIHVAVYPPDCNIRIAAPNKLDDDAIRLFAISKISWIKKNIKKLENQERQTPRDYVSGESHYFQGRRYLLNVIKANTPPKVILRNKKYIDLHIRENTSLEQKHKLMQDFYRKELKKIIPPLIEKWEEILDVKVNEFGIKQMKTKWGTCNPKAKRIWLNLELAKKNETYLEYVILHELVHFFERTHNDSFVAYMDKYMPKWKSFKQELNDFIL